MTRDLPAPDLPAVRARVEGFLSEWSGPWLDHVRSLSCETLEPAALSDALLSAAASAGLLGLEVSPRQGGLGLSFQSKCVVAELLGAADFSLAMTLINSHNIAAMLARRGSLELCAQWLDPLLRGERVGCTALTEPSAGSDATALQTRAHRVSGGWRLEGEKAWIINADRADCIHVYAQTEPGSGARGIASFLVDAHRAGFERLPPAPAASARALGTGGFRLNGYVCGEADLIAPPGEAFRAAMDSINGARIYVAAICCGMLQSCIDEAARYGNDRQSFGSPLVQHQGWRWALAQAAVELDAARALVASASLCVDDGLDARAPAARAKVFATQCAQRQIPALMHLMGAEGLVDHRPFQRHLAAAQIASLTDGATEMLLDRIGHEFIRR